MSWIDIAKILAPTFLLTIVLTIAIMKLTNNLEQRPECTNCQTLVWHWTINCPKCGQPIFCQGHENIEPAPGANFCRECGKHLKKEES